MSAWACEAGITLAQAFVGEKTNEITAIPQLLEMLNLKGAVVTIDGMDTRRAIAEKIVKNGDDYILSVKGNQGRLHDETRDQFTFALRRMALNAHNRMPFEGKKRKSLAKRELRATDDSDYLEKLLSLM